MPEVETLTGEVVETREAVTPSTRAEGAAVARQAAAVAAGSLAAGLATVVVARLAVSSRGARRARRARKSLPVVATRSFLVDVHVLDPRR